MILTRAQIERARDLAHDYYSPRGYPTVRDLATTALAYDDEANAYKAAHTAAEARILELTNNATMAEDRIRELEELLADYAAEDAEDNGFTNAIAEGNTAAMKHALGIETYNRFWGPELERLGRVMDTITVQRDAAEARIADLEAALRAEGGESRLRALEEGLRAFLDHAPVNESGIDGAYFVHLERLRALLSERSENVKGGEPE